MLLREETMPWAGAAGHGSPQRGAHMSRPPQGRKSSYERPCSWGSPRGPPLLVCFGENGDDRPEGGHRTGMETRNRTTLFRGLVVDVEQMEGKFGDKGWHPYQVVKHPGGVGVLPLHEDGTVTLIRQLRPAVGAHRVEIHAGRLAPRDE